MTHPNFKAAVVQAAPEFLGLDKTIDKSIALIEEAASNGAKIIAFPETWLPGYPFYTWVELPAVWMQRYTQRYFDNSLEYGTAEARRLAQAAKDNNIMVSMGLSERSGGSLYIAQWLIDNDGTTISQRRKLKPTHVERTIFGEGDGSDLRVSATSIGRVGELCCWEHVQPLSRYALFAQNEQIHVGCWPSFSVLVGKAFALGPEVSNAVSRTYAVEGQCYVLAPCAVISQVMVDEICSTDEQRDILRPGGGYARIYGPDGQELGVSLAPDEEGLVYADIDLGMISLAKAVADPAGHYARPDSTQLIHHKGTRRPVIDPMVSGGSTSATEHRLEQQNEVLESVEEILGASSR